MRQFKWWFSVLSLQGIITRHHVAAAKSIATFTAEE
jgi:hypothetical protein